MKLVAGLLVGLFALILLFGCTGQEAAKAPAGNENQMPQAVEKQAPSAPPAKIETPKPAPVPKAAEKPQAGASAKGKLLSVLKARENSEWNVTFSESMGGKKLYTSVIYKKGDLISFMSLNLSGEAGSVNYYLSGKLYTCEKMSGCMAMKNKETADTVWAAQQATALFLTYEKMELLGEGDITELPAKTVAGTEALCFDVPKGIEAMSPFKMGSPLPQMNGSIFEYCFSKSGAPLLMNISIASRPVALRQAESYTESVSEKEFALPYPVQEI